MASFFYPRKKHGLLHATPAMSWDEALPLGNGLLGALVWGDGDPLNLSLDRTDLWDLRPVPEFHTPEYTFRQMKQWHEDGNVDAQVRMYEDTYSRPNAPTKIPAGRIQLTFADCPPFDSASLELREALASVLWRRGERLQAFVHARRPVGMVAVETRKPLIIKLLAPPFGGAGGTGEAEDILGSTPLSHLGYSPPVETSGAAWQAFTQQGVEGLHFAVYVAWKKTRRGWAITWSIASSFDGADPLALARENAETALKAGFRRMLSSHRSWWDRYWKRSSVRLSNPTLERLWYLEQYKFGSASRRGAPPITLQGPWTADNRCIPPWKGDYHHDLNTQLSYWPCYSANHLEEGLAFLDWLWETLPECYDWTRRFFEAPGLNVPGVADFKNRSIGGWRQYTHASTTAAWLAHHFYLHWRYSADRLFLRDRAYPFLRDAAIFLEAITEIRDAQGLRTLPLSASPEIHDNRPEAWFATVTNYDLALIRWLFAAAAELAVELKRPEDTDRWRNALSEMPDFALADDGRLLITQGVPLPDSHRHFSHLMAIHPLGLIDLEDGPDAQRTVRAALGELDRLGPDWWCGYSYAWLANLAARARDGARAEWAIDIFATAFTLRSSFHCNGDQTGKGYSKYTYRPFTLEGNFAAAAGVQEMLLQSQRGVIRVFPAIPATWRDVAFATFRAEGGFLVSARRVNGAVQRVDLFSETGGVCRIVSPFTGEEQPLRLRRGERVTLTE